MDSPREENFDSSRFTEEIKNRRYFSRNAQTIKDSCLYVTVMVLKVIFAFGFGF